MDVENSPPISWGWLLALGILTGFVGLTILGNVVLTTVASVALIGTLLIVGAIVQLIAAFRGPDHGTHVLIGVLYALAGLAFLSRPLAASIGLTVIVGLSFIAAGISRVVVGNHLRKVQRGAWVIAGGVISVLAGLMILSGLPTTGLWVVGFLIGFEMLMNGITYSMVALGIRHESRAVQVNT